MRVRPGFGRLFALLVLPVLAPAVKAVTPDGIVYESEAISTPKDAWRKDQGSADRWNLWTTEEDIDRKRSGHGVLASPVVKADRKTPEEGAPPLHSVVTDLKPGTYHIYVSAPGRPLAYSLDGKEWEKYEGGELDLGLRTLPQGRFELWIDDRYAAPAGNPGPGYYDYLRFTPATAAELEAAKHARPPAIENVETWSPEPGTVHLCWTSSVLMPPASVTVTDGTAELTCAEQGGAGRNHRVILTGLDPAKGYHARIAGKVTGQPVRSADIAFRAAPPRLQSKPQTIELTVPEPTEAGRTAWPAVAGVPFARGQLGSVDDLRLFAAGGQPLPLQTRVFSRWPDGSVKWATLGFDATTQLGQLTRYRLEAAPRWITGPPSARNAVTVLEDGQAWHVTSDAIAFDLGKAIPALFANVGIDRNHDGRIADDERVAAAPIAANLRLDADGTFLSCGPPEKLEVEDNGPVRAILRWTGPLRDAQGKGDWRYLLRLTLWHGLPVMGVSVSVIDDSPEPGFRSVGMLALRVPLDAQGGVKGGFDGAPLEAVPDADGLQLTQDRDNHFRLRTATATKDGERATGVVVAADNRTQVTVAMPHFWETYPSGLAVKPDGVHVRLLPQLPADAYSDADSQQWFLQLYPWFKDGQYRVKAGQLLRKDVFVRYAAAGDEADPVQFAQWVAEPLVPQASAQYLTGTAVLGRALFPRTPGVWDRYEQYFERGFQDSLKDREAQRSYGWMTFGDWYGERGNNYGNSEYDMGWTLALQWLRTLDRRYLDRGWQMVQHNSTTDTVWGSFSNSWNGLVYEHSYNHMGADIQRDDPRFTGPKWADYMRQYGSSMFRGAIDRQGHVFQQGNWLYAALTGDPWYRETAERVCTNQAEKLTPRYDFTIERAGGWPLINMGAAYSFSGNPYYLNAARLMIERTLQRQDPETGGWPHTPPLDETDGEKVWGGKPFAVGILTHGILRYLEQEPNPRPDVEKMVVRGADWLMNEAWTPGKGFVYITRAKKYVGTGGRGLTATLVAECVAYAAEKTGQAQYKQFWQTMMEGLFEGSPGGMGKNFSQGLRQTVFALDRMRTLGVTDNPRPATAMLRDRIEVTGGAAHFRVMVDNPAKEPRTTTVTATAGGKTTKADWLAPAGQRSSSPPLTLAVAAPAELTVQVTVAGLGATTLKARLIAPPPLPAAHRGQGVAYVGPAESPTRRALKAVGLDLPAITDPVHADLGQYAGLVVACDSWQSKTANLPAATDALAAFVRAGGRLAIWQLNDDSWNPGWLPADLYVADDDTTLATVLANDHPLFAGVGNLSGAKSFDSLSPVEAPWTVLAKDALGGPAIVEASIGRGRILVIEPSFDRYAAANGDEPDNVVKPADAQRLVKNLVAYLAQ